MKLLTAIFFSVILLTVHAVVAQDANLVPVPEANPTPSSEPTPAPLFPTDNPPPPVSRPHSTGSNPEPRPPGAGAQKPASKKLTTAESTEAIADRIKFREAKTKALRDEKIQAEIANVDAANTDVEKRAALKRYYTLLYAKILKIDGSIKKLVDARLAQSLKTLDQSKVRPEDYPQQASKKP